MGVSFFFGTLHALESDQPLIVERDEVFLNKATQYSETTTVLAAVWSCAALVKRSLKVSLKPVSFPFLGYFLFAYPLTLLETYLAYLGEHLKHQNEV